MNSCRGRRITHFSSTPKMIVALTVLFPLLRLLDGRAPRSCTSRAGLPALPPVPTTPSVLGTSLRLSPPQVSSPNGPVESLAPPSQGGGSPPRNCQCGYILTRHTDAYFPLARYTDFSDLQEGRVPPQRSKDKGWVVTDGYGVGAPGPDGTTPFGSIDTFSASDGVLQLTMPGGQAKRGKVRVAEMAFDTPKGMTGGVFTMQAQLDGMGGTCQAMVSGTYMAWRRG
jgi:hypothetical protein